MRLEADRGSQAERNGRMREKLGKHDAHIETILARQDQHDDRLNNHEQRITRNETRHDEQDRLSMRHIVRDALRKWPMFLRLLLLLVVVAALAIAVWRLAPGFIQTVTP